MTDAVDAPPLADPVIDRPRNRIWEKFRRNPSALFGGTIVSFFVVGHL